MAKRKKKKGEEIRLDRMPVVVERDRSRFFTKEMKSILLFVFWAVGVVGLIMYFWQS